MIDKIENPGTEFFSPAKAIGELLKEKLKKESDFYFFSPDETTSNKFTSVFDASSRAWDLKIEPWDLPESSSGRIIEMLSENVLFGTMVGHLHNNEPAMLGSYEAFLNIIGSQLVQELKYIKQLKQVPGHEPVASVNLLSTSTCWRQDHNGFTHQSPALISTLLSIPNEEVTCYFPIDDVAATENFNHIENAKNTINIITFNKNPEPRYIDSHHAAFQIKNSGASIFQFASDENPEIIITAAGDAVSTEALEAVKILKNDMPNLKIRFVGINSLSYNSIGPVENRLTKQKFSELFPDNIPIFAIFHGFPETLNQILRSYTTDNRKIKTLGFLDQGTTTTPFEMLDLNRASRFHLAAEIANFRNRPDLTKKYLTEIQTRRNFAKENGFDLN